MAEWHLRRLGKIGQVTGVADEGQREHSSVHVPRVVHEEAGKGWLDESCVRGQEAATRRQKTSLRTLDFKIGIYRRAHSWL